MCKNICFITICNAQFLVILTTKLESNEKSRRPRNGIFFAKVKKIVIRNSVRVFETMIINWDDCAGPKIQYSIFEDELSDCRCSNNPIRHANTLHCAERKAFGYGTWTRCLLNNVNS